MQDSNYELVSLDHRSVTQHYSHKTRREHGGDSKSLCHIESQMRDGNQGQDQDVHIRYKTKSRGRHTELECVEVSRSSKRLNPSLTQGRGGNSYLCYEHGRIPCPNRSKTDINASAKPGQWAK
jgi:hypothetical protein